MVLAYGFFGVLREDRAPRQRRPDLRPDVGARRDADAARHRRHRPDHRHGGRFQRAHLRAHARGGAAWPIGGSSLDAGFARALATIIDANLTTLIAAVALFFLGTGPGPRLRGDVVLGILTTVFTAFTLTRLMIALWFRSRGRKAHRDRLSTRHVRSSNTSRPIRKFAFMRFRRMTLSVLGLPVLLSVLLFFGWASTSASTSRAAP